VFIEFQKLRVSNFLSYGKTPTEIVLNRTNTTLLLGDSGAGKSSIPNAISFVLFDDTFRSIRKGQLVNSTNEKNCLVELDFKIGKRQYTVRRGIKPNLLEIFVDGVPLDKQYKVNDFQDYLEKDILKFDKKTFHQIVSLAEVNFVPFMQLEAKDRRTFVEKVLGVEIFSFMNALLKAKKKETIDRIHFLDTRSDGISEKIKIHTDYIEKKKSESKQRLKEVKVEIEETSARNSAAEKELTKIRDVELPPIIANLPKKKDTQALLEKATEQLGKVDAKIHDHMRRFELLNQEKCSTCSRPFSKEKAAEQKKIIAAKLEELNLVAAKGKKVKHKLKKKLEMIEEKHDQIRAIRTKMENKTFAIKQFTSSIEKLTQQSIRLKEAKEDNVQDIVTEIEALQLELKGDQKETKKLKNLSEIHDTALQLLKDDGVKAEIVRKYIPKINLYVNKYLQSMGLEVSFHLNQDFDEVVKTRGKESFSYNSFSAGQRQRIDLALLLTWRSLARARNSINTNLLFLDEVLDSHLNVEATESLVEMFNAKLFKGTNIFVISHKRELATKFTRVLNFELRNGFTKVS